MLEEIERKGFKILKTGRSDEIRINCPFCGSRVGREDTKFHMYINLTMGLVHCFRCGYGAKTSKFFKDLETGDDSAELDFDEYGNLQKVLHKGYTLRIDLPFPSIEHYDYRLKDLFFNYIKQVRGLSESIVYEYDLRVGINGFKNRLIFPVKEAFVDIYFTGRKVFQGPGEKYKNPKEGEYGVLIGKSEVVYNIDNVPEGADKVVIQEGPFDVIATHNKPYPTVAIFGKTISKRQLYKLLLKRPEQIVICLDSDAVQEAITIAKSVSKLVKTSVLALKEGDPADWKEKYWENGELIEVDPLFELRDKLSKPLKWHGRRIEI